MRHTLSFEKQSRDSRYTSVELYGHELSIYPFIDRYVVGPCTVLGVAQHLVWYQMNVGPGTILGSWTVHACRDILAQPQEFSLQRHTVIKPSQDLPIVLSRHGFEQAQNGWTLRLDQCLLLHAQQLATAHGYGPYILCTYFRLANDIYIYIHHAVCRWSHVEDGTSNCATTRHWRGI
jgi:hypothetical protein